MSGLPTAEAELLEITLFLFFESQGCKTRLAIGSESVKGFGYRGLGSLMGDSLGGVTQWGSGWYWGCGGGSSHGNSQGGVAM